MIGLRVQKNEKLGFSHATSFRRMSEETLLFVCCYCRRVCTIIDILHTVQTAVIRPTVLHTFPDLKKEKKLL